MEPAPPLTLRRVLFFWLPLAFTWLMMSAEGPFLAAVIARLAEPKYNLAAFGVAFSLALIVEAPIIMMMSAATALVRDRSSYLRMRNFTTALNLAVTVAMLAIAIPKVFNLVAFGLLGLPPEIAARTHLAILILLPWPAAIGFRRFYQGVLIRHGQTRRVAYGTVVRLVAMIATGLGLYRAGDIEGVLVGAAALSAGVTVEMAASRMMAHRTVRRLLCESATAGSEPLTYCSIAVFYYPLALTSLLTLGVHPVVTFFMAHGRAAVESLAVLPVVGSLVFIFRALGLAYQEVGIALIGDRLEGYATLRSFATLLGIAVVAALVVIAWTPLATVWFRSISGLSPELTRFALAPTRILAIIPGLTVLLSFQRAMLVNLKATVLVTWATAIEVVGVVSVLVIGVFALDVVGAIVAAAALVVGRLGANIFLVPPLRRMTASRPPTQPGSRAEGQ
jgi:hypothetical protein